MDDKWFTKSNDCMYTTLEDATAQVVKFNEVSGRGLDTELQLILIEEEYRELLEAFANKDKEEYLKELCDLYIVSSYYHHDLLSEGYLNRLILRSWGMSDSLRKLPHDIDPYEHILMCVNIFNNIDADWQGALQNVLDSNMSKYTDYRPECIEEYDAWSRIIESGGRYTGVSWELRNSKVIWTDSYGKILRGPDYVKANVGQFIN